MQRTRRGACRNKCHTHRIREGVKNAFHRNIFHAGVHQRPPVFDDRGALIVQSPSFQNNESGDALPHLMERSQFTPRFFLRATQSKLKEVAVVTAHEGIDRQRHLRTAQPCHQLR